MQHHVTTPPSRLPARPGWRWALPFLPALALCLQAAALVAVVADAAPAAAAQQEFSGVGAEINLDGDAVRVVRTLDGGGAARGGLLAGDRITSIDGEPVAGLSLPNVTTRLRGPVGSAVTVTVERAGRAPFDLVLTRGTVTLPPAEAGTQPGPGVADLLAFDAKGFVPPRIDGLAKGETSQIEATPYLDGAETVIESFSSPAADQVAVLTTNGVRWAVIDKKAGANGIIFRDPDCSGVFSERMAEGHGRGVPICALVTGTAAAPPGVAFSPEGFTAPSLDGLQMQPTPLANESAAEIPGQESAVEVYPDGKGGFVYRLLTNGVAWGIAVEGAATAPEGSFILRDPNCAGRLLERVPFDPAAMYAPVCAIVAAPPAEPQADSGRGRSGTRAGSPAAPASEAEGGTP